MSGDATDTSTDMKKPLIQDLSADNDEMDVTEIESLCLRCHDQVFSFSWKNALQAVHLDI